VKKAVPAPKPIRHAYVEQGAEGYYRSEGATYRNPHEQQLRRALALAVQTWSPDLSRVLDLACGSGEATLCLRELGAAHIEGADPFTGAAFRARTGLDAHRWSFGDIAAGAMAGRRYSLIVCSFALHLAERSRLAGICRALADAAPALLILTPHKRPELRAQWGWALRGELVEERVRARLYDRAA